MPTFFEAYRAALLRTVVERPAEYAIRPAESPELYATRTADKMIAAMRERGNVNSVNTDSLSFRRACATCGIKATRVAMNERIAAELLAESRARGSRNSATTYRHQEREANKP